MQTRQAVGTKVGLDMRSPCAQAEGGLTLLLRVTLASAFDVLLLWQIQFLLLLWLAVRVTLLLHVKSCIITIGYTSHITTTIFNYISTLIRYSESQIGLWLR